MWLPGAGKGGVSGVATWWWWVEWCGYLVVLE